VGFEHVGKLFDKSLEPHNQKIITTINHTLIKTVRGDIIVVLELVFLPSYE
jgi:hypothetical protein